MYAFRISLGIRHLALYGLYRLLLAIVGGVRKLALS